MANSLAYFVLSHRGEYISTGNLSLYLEGVGGRKGRGGIEIPQRFPLGLSSSLSERC